MLNEQCICGDEKSVHVNGLDQCLVKTCCCHLFKKADSKEDINLNYHSRALRMSHSKRKG